MRDWVSKVVVLCLLPDISHHALTEQQEALVGLRGAGAFVEEMDPENSPPGLKQRQMQYAVELRLRKAGVRVLTRTVEEETPGQSYVLAYIRFSYDCFITSRK